MHPYNKISVIIPAYNEQDSIGFVIRDIPRDIAGEIIVIDNGSDDRTGLIAADSGATVLEEPSRGYGNACLSGIQYLTEKRVPPDIVVFLDGDYSDYPGEMRELIKPIQDYDYDLVIGSRMTGRRERGAMLPQALFGNRLATFLIYIIYGVRFTDLGPFRAIKYKKLLELDMQDTTYGWTVEMQVKAVQRGFRCIEVPVSYRKRIGVSKITGTITGSIKAGYKIIWTILKNIQTGKIR